MNFDESVKIAIITSFATGVFIFIANQLSNFLKRLIDRKTKHYNALVFYEEQLNKNLATLSDNIYLIEGTKGILERGEITFSIMKRIEIDESRLVDLHNMELRNDMLSYINSLRKINDDLESIMRWYQQIKELLIFHNDQKMYSANCTQIAEELKMIEKFMKKAINEDINVIAKIRVRSRRDLPFTSKIISKLIGIANEKVSETDFALERQKLLEEIEEIKGKSRKEIEELTKGE